MKYALILTASIVLAVSPAAQAQDCSAWTNWDLRGTYMMSGSGWLDLSKVFPGKGLPVGLNPMSFVGGHVFNGAGGGTGWVIMNIAGIQMNPEYSKYTYTVRPDCSVLVTYNLTYKELGVTLPFTRITIIVPKTGGLELHSLSAGRPATTPVVSGVNLNVLHRVSMQY